MNHIFKLSRKNDKARNWLEIVFITCIALSMHLHANAQYIGSSDSPYLEAGGGTSVFQHPHIADMTVARLPLHFYTEYGKFLNRFAITAGYDFNARYSLDNFHLSPSFVFLHLKGYLTEKSLDNGQIALFAFAGPIYQNTKLIDEGNNTVVTYEYKEEAEQGFGFTAGAGAQLLISNFVFATKIYVVRSQASYLAGGFTDQNFQTGSDRVQLTIGYRFNLHKNNRRHELLCPTYY